VPFDGLGAAAGSALGCVLFHFEQARAKIAERVGDRPGNAHLRDSEPLADQAPVNPGNAMAEMGYLRSVHHQNRLAVGRLAGTAPIPVALVSCSPVIVPVFGLPVTPAR
jgi:hypothetical protein